MHNVYKFISTDIANRFWVWKYDTSVPWPMAFGSRDGARLVNIPDGTVRVSPNTIELDYTSLLHFRMTHDYARNVNSVDFLHSDSELGRRPKHET